ncbi:MAG: GNAT family N-acetyltransferase [Devosia sp.]
MKLPGVAWRAMTGYDFEAVEKIAAEVHPGFFEAPEILAEKQRLYRSGAYLLEIIDRPVGYVLSHPWASGTIPALNESLGRLPENPDTYYVHDLALLPVARRIGAAAFIVEALAKHAAAHGFTNMSLVAVNGSQPFWERHQFEGAYSPELVPKLLDYEPEARLMVRSL